MTVEIGPLTHFDRNVYVDKTATVGADCRIGANVWIGSDVTIGERCVIQPGCVIGSDGFGYERDEAGEWVQKPHPCGVEISANVHIGANTVVNRGSWRKTRIGYGTRIDALVFIAHNVELGSRVIVVAHAELSGSVAVGDGAWIGPRACVKERVIVGPRALVGMGAVVLKDVPPNVTVAGCPARVIDATQGVREPM